MSRPTLGARVFSVILRAYPPEYRRRMRAGAEGTFAELEADAARAGERGRMVARAWFGALRGILPAWVDAGTEWHGTMTKGGTSMLGGTTMKIRIRRLAKEPAFTLSVIALLAIGIGAAAAIVSVVDAVLFRPLPYPGAERLVYFDNGSHSEPDIRAWRERLGTMEVVAGVRPSVVSVTGTEVVERAMAARVTDGFLVGFGATSRFGRLITPTDYDREQRVAVLGHGFWERSFGRAPDVLGRLVAVDGIDYEIVGVLAPGFRAPDRIVGSDVDLWLPVLRSDGILVDPQSRALAAYGLTRPGVTLTQVQTEVDEVMVQLEVEAPEAHQDPDGNRLEVPVRRLSDAIAEPVRAPLLVLLAAAGLLFLAACSNAAGLFLARGLGRQRSWSVQMALGAGRSTVVGDVLAEALILATAGTACGLLLAWVGLDLLVTFQPDILPRAGELGLGSRTVALALALAAGATIAFGGLPAVRATRASAAGALRSSRSGGGAIESRLQAGLVSVQVGLTTLLLLGAGLLSRSLLEMTAIDLGMDTRDAVYASVPLGREATTEERIRIIRDLRAGLAAVPGVRAVGGGLTSPLQYTGGGRCCWGVSFTSDGVEYPNTFANPVTTDYFEGLGIEVVEGRTFRDEDVGTSPVAVVLNRSAADMIAPDGRALGRMLQLQTGEGAPSPALVIGVTEDVRHWGPTEAVDPFVYVPWESHGAWASRFGLAIRVAEVEAGTIGAIRDAAAAAVPSIALDLMPYDRLSGQVAARPRFFAVLIGLFAASALLIASAGLFATLLYHVRQRRRDVGIRLALGADQGRIATQILGRGAGTVAAGALLGALLLPLASRGLEQLLFEVSTTDPRTVVAVLGLLGVTTVLATWVPARLAARTDPINVLREE